MDKPSLQQLIDRAKATMVAKLGVDNPAIDALAAAIGGGNYGNYAYQDYLFRQMHPETADEDWLYIWAERFDVQRIEAKQATGSVTFTVTGGVILVPSGIVLKNSDGLEFVTTQAVMSDLPVSVMCAVPGTIGNQSAGVKLSMVTAVAGLDPSEIVISSMAGGADIEDIERWRGRILSGFNGRYMVGKSVDYVDWSMAAHPDVGFAFVRDNYPIVGLVSVFVGGLSADPDLSDQVIAIVQSYIDARRLAGCHVDVVKPAKKAVDISLSAVSNVSERELIVSKLNEFFVGRMASRDRLTPSDIMMTLSAVSDHFGLVSPTLAVEVGTDEVLVLGDVLWQ